MTLMEKKAREAWDTLLYHFDIRDVPAMKPENLQWPPEVEQVRLMYRTIAARVHPDVGGSAEVFQNVTEARITLCNFLETARPVPTPNGTEIKLCKHCGGIGYIKFPSRALGGRGLKKKCSDCAGHGVTCH